MWRRPLSTNKDGFSFTGRMHLHSLEAKASEPGLMKRKPGNWLDFNANERERETEMIQKGEKSEEEGREKKKQQELAPPPLSEAVIQGNMAPVNPAEGREGRPRCNQNLLRVGRLHLHVPGRFLCKPVTAQTLINLPRREEDFAPPSPPGSQRGPARRRPSSPSAFRGLEPRRDDSASSILSNDPGSTA